MANKYESMTINGNVVKSGDSYEAKLNKGDNRFSIIVTASEKITKTYTLTLTRGGTTNNPFGF